MDVILISLAKKVLDNVLIETFSMSMLFSVFFCIGFFYLMRKKINAEDEKLIAEATKEIAESKSIEVNSALNIFNATIQSLTEEVRRLRTRIEKLEKENVSLKENLTNSLAQLKKLSASYSELKEDRVKLEQEISGLLKKNQELRDRCQQLETQNIVLKQQMDIFIKKNKEARQ